MGLFSRAPKQVTLTLDTPVRFHGRLYRAQRMDQHFGDGETLSIDFIPVEEWARRYRVKNFEVAPAIGDDTPAEAFIEGVSAGSASSCCKGGGCKNCG